MPQYLYSTYEYVLRSLKFMQYDQSACILAGQGPPKKSLIPSTVLALKSILKNVQY